MRNELFAFQKKAVREISEKIETANKYFQLDHKPQVIAFQAPTGSGKTIMMTAVIENMLFENPDSIFVWLSDSPQLNEQSMEKIILKADRIRPNQCEIISDESFDREILDDGHIYFLNTQKLSKSSRLVSYGDNRTYTIWDTLSNTASEKSNRLYVVIDEAHRGMRNDKDRAKANTIMQKFIKGSPQEHLAPMPIVIGMSATDERFRRLVDNTQSVRHDVTIKAQEVRASGLLKDRIRIVYPDNNPDEMILFSAAVEEWKDKCLHWGYCDGNVLPIFVVQVENKTNTDLGECLKRIRNGAGVELSEHNVVHTFGDKGTIDVNGLPVHHVEASRISDDKNIRVVFFKENLSVGWDCPRAETMMSFRSVEDSTYIAQLLGRMIRTPLQMRIDTDETLNEVKLFLPKFNKDNVEKVIQELQNEEGGEIPSDIEGEKAEEPKRGTWTYKQRGKKDDKTIPIPIENSDPLFKHVAPEINAVQHTSEKEKISAPSNSHEQITIRHEREIDREGIANFVNNVAGLVTYKINRSGYTAGHMESLVRLASLLKNQGIEINALDSVRKDGIKLIEDYIVKLKKSGEYDGLVRHTLGTKLSEQIFDILGINITPERQLYYYTIIDDDIFRRFQNARKKFGDSGIADAYHREHFDGSQENASAIDVILFAGDSSRLKELDSYAENKFKELNKKYRIKLTTYGAKVRADYCDIVTNSNNISEQLFYLPETINRKNQDGEKYYDHFFIDTNEKFARIKLNSWESRVIEEEREQSDFECWLRNFEKESWALSLVVDEKTNFYPDFLVFRRKADGYVVDILEPHGGHLADSLSKAKALAKYKEENQESQYLGRVQLIRVDGTRIKRLDFSEQSIRKCIMNLSTENELNTLFQNL